MGKIQMTLPDMCLHHIFRSEIVNRNQGMQIYNTATSAGGAKIDCGQRRSVKNTTKAHVTATATQPKRRPSSSTINNPHLTATPRAQYAAKTMSECSKTTTDLLLNL